MKSFVMIALCAAAIGFPHGARAQIAPPVVPQPVAPPPPKIEVPAVPQLDAPPAPVRAAKPPGRRSFGDRVSKCLDQGAASGLDASERATYSRACANQ